MSEIARCRRMLFAGNLKVKIESPRHVDVTFRVQPALFDGNPWDGRQWWLWRGSEYVGIIHRRGSAFDLIFTGRSTDSLVIRSAAGLLLDALSGNDQRTQGYTVTGSDRCGGCRKTLTPGAAFDEGICIDCMGSK